MIDVKLVNKSPVLDKYGNADTVSGAEADSQIIRNGLLIILGTFFDDLTAGVDWPTALKKGYGINALKSEVRRALLAISVVEQVITLNIGTPDKDRAVVLTFAVKTANGIITFSEEL